MFTIFKNVIIIIEKRDIEFFLNHLIDKKEITYIKTSIKSYHMSVLNKTIK